MSERDRDGAGPGPTGAESERTPRRRAFTLVELMVAIVIIAILIALLLPAVNSVIRRTRIARVVTEIKDLEAALANFKAKYGMYPPSRITLYEVAAQWNQQFQDPIENSERLQSKAVIRRLWPQFDFSLNRNFYDANLANPAFDLDPDHDGRPGITLTGSTCLVFFLGGISGNIRYGTNRAPTQITWTGPTGFSKNPRDPFVSGGSREGPYFEFDTTRLVPAATAQNAGTAFATYKDPLPNQTLPYLYLSSYEGRGYPPTSPTPAADYGGYLLPGGAYRQLSASGQFFKSKSFQIISPGYDGQFGTGGPYNPDDPSTLNVEDRDNITNFANGMLGE